MQYVLIVCIVQFYGPLNSYSKVTFTPKKHTSLKFYSDLDCGVLQALAQEEEFKIALQQILFINRIYVTENDQAHNIVSVGRSSVKTLAFSTIQLQGQNNATLESENIARNVRVSDDNETNDNDDEKDIVK